MEFLDLAKSRYTTKTYDDKKKVSEDDIQRLKEILRLSPSSINSQPWNFVFVSDPKVKSELAAASFFNEGRINESSHLVVFRVIDDIAKFEERINLNLPEVAVTYYNTFLKPSPEAEIKSWMAHQVYLSLGFFLSACASMGIDSTPMEGVDKDVYDKVLGKSGYTTLFAVAIGYRNEEDHNQPSKNPKSRLDSKNIITAI